MGIFGLFKKKEKSPEKIEEPEKLEAGDVPLCEQCHNRIEPWDKGTTFQKKKYHLKCMRRLRKQASRMAFQ